MSAYAVETIWSRKGESFVDQRYSRRHTLRFDGGIDVPGSSSPHVVPIPLSDPAAVDPEEAFTASLSSCHLLWFLAIAAKRGFVVDEYRDRAEGELGRNPDGKLAMTVVTLRPEVTFSGGRMPSRTEIDTMHEEAHEACFIARSVRTVVRCEPVYTGSSEGSP